MNLQYFVGPDWQVRGRGRGLRGLGFMADKRVTILINYLL